MKGLIGTRLGLVVVVAAMIAMSAGFLGFSRVLAQNEAIGITSESAAPGAQVSVDMSASGIGPPGLGAWTIDIVYDPAVLTAVSCSPAQGGVCNTAYGANTVRVSGASANGVEGDNVLASIEFRCEVEGSSAVTPVIDLLVDATIGDPQPLEAAEQAGSVTCQETPPTSTPGATNTPGAPAATSTPAGSSLPVAGTGFGRGVGGGSDGGGAPFWLIAGLTGAGLAWLVAVLAGAGLAGATSSSSAGVGGRWPTSGGYASRDDGARTRADSIPSFIAMRRRDRRP